MIQISYPYMTTGNTIALTIGTFVSKVMLYRFVIAFLPRNKCLLISWLHSLYSVILEFNKIKCVTVYTVSLYINIYLEVMWPMILDFLFLFVCLFINAEFQTSFFNLSKRLFSSSVFVIRVASSACLSLLMFPLAVLIPACYSFSLAFHMMYSEYKLNNQDDYAALLSFPSFKPVSCSMSGSKLCFLTCINFSQRTDKVIWHYHLFKNFSQFPHDSVSKESSCKARDPGFITGKERSPEEGNDNPFQHSYL